MDEANIIYIVLGLLYNLAGTVFIGTALFFKNYEALLPIDLSNSLSNSQLMLNRTRQNLDGSVGMIMLFSGFALQAIGVAGQTANSNVSFLLVASLFLLILVHFLYIRDVYAEQYVRARLSEISQSEKNKAYFGTP